MREFKNNFKVVKFKTILNACFTHSSCRCSASEIVSSVAFRHQRRQDDGRLEPVGDKRHHAVPAGRRSRLPVGVRRSVALRQGQF